MLDEITRLLNPETREWFERQTELGGRTQTELIARCIELVHSGDAQGDLAESVLDTRVSDVESRINELEKKVATETGSDTTDPESLSFRHEHHIETESIVVDTQVTPVTISQHLSDNRITITVTGIGEVVCSRNLEGDDGLQIDHFDVDQE